MTDMSFDRVETFPGGELCFVFAVAGADAMRRQTIEPTVDLPEFPAEVPADVLAAVAALWTPGAVAAWRAARYPPPSAEEAMAAQIAAIQARRARAIEAFTHLGQAVTLSSQTQQDIGNAIAALARKPPGSAISWEIRDGIYVDLDLTALEAFGDAAFDHVQACFGNTKAMTAAAIAGQPYDIEAGWP